jgi:glutathione synthase/RimK-type ligase-like ATP-grasp enzyme
MKIAIHKTNRGFAPHWISYCDAHRIAYKVVNCYDSDIIEQLTDCDALMWHHHHAGPKDVVFAKQLLAALEHSGLIVFPNFKSGWHFDDKVAQKYLYEALNIPTPKTWIFYDEKEAIAWARTAEFPKVFKLRAGAGSYNVKLSENRNAALRLIKKAFATGFRTYSPISNLKERIRKYRNGKVDLLVVLKGLARLVSPPRFSKIKGREIGYAYFQEFIPGCSFDYRVKVVGDRCWGYQRVVRKGDFRASGSAQFHYSKDAIPPDILALSFKIYRTLGMQSVAFDFLKNERGEILLVEASYGFGVDDGEFHGHWDDTLHWHEGRFNPYGWMIDKVVSQLNDRKIQRPASLSL